MFALKNEKLSHPDVRNISQAAFHFLFEVLSGSQTRKQQVNLAISRIPRIPGQSLA